MCSAAEQQALRQLAVFRGSFGLEAATAITEGTAETLAHLIEKSLIRQHADSRYDIHRLLQQYLLDRLAEADEVRTIRDRHLHHYLALSESAAPELRGANQLDWIERLDAEHANIRDAIFWALQDGQTDAALRIESNL